MKAVYNKIKMTIKSGQTTAEKYVNIDPGKRVYALAVVKPSPDKIVDLGLYENSTEIHPQMDISVYDGKIGSFEQRGVQLDYSGGSEITAKAAVKTAVTKDTEIEVIFLSQQENQC